MRLLLLAGSCLITIAKSCIALDSKRKSFRPPTPQTFLLDALLYI